MTDDEQRIAIAEACGWKVLHQQPNANESKITILLRPDGEAKMWAQGHTNLASFDVNLPDYLDDLNAMAEAEKVLIREQWYDSNGERTKTQWDKYQERLLFKIDATAAQRAEAFLRTIGKWQD